MTQQETPRSMCGDESSRRRCIWWIVALGIGLISLLRTTQAYQNSPRGYAPALAWPSVGLVLLGFVYRKQMRKCLKRNWTVETPGGLKFSAIGASPTIKAQLEEPKNKDAKELMDIAEGGDPQVLRLLAVVVAVGNLQNVTLATFKGSENRRAKQLLKQRGFVSHDGRLYKPTRKGFDAIQQYLGSVVKELVSRSDTQPQ